MHLLPACAAFLAAVFLAPLGASAHRVNACVKSHGKLRIVRGSWTCHEERARGGGVRVFDGEGRDLGAFAGGINGINPSTLWSSWRSSES